MALLVKPQVQLAAWAMTTSLAAKRPFDYPVPITVQGVELVICTSLFAGWGWLWRHDGAQAALLDATVLEHPARGVCSGGSDCHPCRRVQVLHFSGEGSQLTVVCMLVNVLVSLRSSSSVCTHIASNVSEKPRK